jgi:hypothetical protein
VQLPWKKVSELRAATENPATSSPSVAPAPGAQ